MKQKMNQLLKTGILILGFSLFTISCSKENIAEIKQTETQKLQSKYTLDNFDDVFIKNNLKIDWDDFKSNVNSQNEVIAYEFNTSFEVKSSIENYAKYKLLASKNVVNAWSFEIIKFSTNKENISNDLSYFMLNHFTGSIYHYNLKGDNTLIKVFENGKIIEKITVKDFDNVNTLAKAPAVGGTHCLGCWSLVRTEHYTDWYTNSGGGSTLYYSHSTYNGATTEWVYIPGNGDYNGMPYDPEDGAYHNHYDYPHGGGNTDNHVDEDIAESIDDVPPNCESFNYSRVGTTNWQTAAVSGIHELFIVLNWDCVGYDWGIFTQPLYFQLPINAAHPLGSGTTQIESAAYLHSAFLEFQNWYQQNACNSGGEALEQQLLDYIKDEFEEHGGNVTLTPPNGFSGTITPYSITWVGYGNCD
ncbi:hypothetical protein [Lacinutrix salivirga]